MRLILSIFGFLCVAFSGFSGIFDAPVDPLIARGATRFPNRAFAWSSQMPGSDRFTDGEPGRTPTLANTVTGYSFYCGTNTAAFNQIVIPYICTQQGYEPSAVLVRVRSGDYNGTLIAFGTGTMDSALNQELFCHVTLSATVPSGTSVWLEIYTNGRTQFYNITTTGGNPVFPTPTFPTTRYSIGINTKNPAALLTLVSQRLLLFWAYMDTTGSGTVDASSGLVGAIAKSAIGRIATVQPAIDEVASVGTAAYVSIVAGSTFSGHGCYIGDQATAFDAVSVLLYPFSLANVPKRGVMRIRQMPTSTATWGTDNPTAWPIVAESPVIELGLTFEQWSEVTFPLDRSVSGHLWFEVMTDGYIGISRTTDGSGSPTVAEPPKIHYVTGSSLAIPRTMLAHTTHQTLWCRLGRANYGGGKLVPSTELKDLLQDEFTLSFVPSVTISLPTAAGNILPALEGREVNVYFDNVIFANVPIETLAIDVTCTKGTNYAKYWRYTPSAADAGTTTFKLDVYTLDRATLLATATATLKTVALSNPSTPVSRKVLMIGDSTFAANVVAPELVNLFSGDSTYTLTLVGSNTGLGADSNGTNRTTAMEAIGGWSIYRYSTDTNSAWVQINGTNRVGSPFLFGGVFNFASYLTNQGITMSSNDWVIINHGINDVWDYYQDSTLSAQITVVQGYLSTWVTSIKAAVPGIRIAICLTINPSSSQDAFGHNYGNDQTRARYIRNLKFWRENLLSNYDSTTVAGVTLVPYHANLDPENNYPLISRQLNARNTGIYMRQWNAVHPANSGYWQLADMLRSFLKAQE